MTDENERLTEAEWERRRAERECRIYGHDWEIISTLAGPAALTCARPCGDPGYAVARRFPPGRRGALGPDRRRWLRSWRMG